MVHTFFVRPCFLSENWTFEYNNVVTLEIQFFIFPNSH